LYATKISEQSPDDAVLADLGRRLARHRLDRNLTQAQLAHEAGVSRRTLERIEAGQSAQLASFIRVLRALSLIDTLDALVPKPIASPIEQLKLRGKERRRASPKAQASHASDDWTWDDER
jgi:transcriptional regulator with XRE-family HTH domain